MTHGPTVKCEEARMAALTPKQNASVNGLLRHPQGSPEDFIRKRIGELSGRHSNEGRGNHTR